MSRLLFFLFCTLTMVHANGVDNNANGIPDVWESESNISNYLPTPPTTSLYSTQIETDLEVRLDTLEAYTTPLSTNYDKTLCDVSNFWDASRVSVGGRASGNAQEVCKVQLSSSDYYLQFLTKWPISNIHYPLTPEPAWAMFRFPIPKGHIANQVEYKLNWYKLFGSKPTNCHSTQIDATTGECNLDVAENWRDDVDAGLYLLWTTPGSTQQFMTGPHAPIELIGYSGVSTFKVSVPEAFQEVEELDVTFVSFNQYTIGCAKDSPTTCGTGENENFKIKSVTLKTEIPFKPTKEPKLAHPRILGNNKEWRAYYQPFEDMDCIESALDSDWGVVFNSKNIWDKTTKGVTLCRNGVSDSISTISDAKYYLDPLTTDTWLSKRALRILFLLRDQMDCLAQGSGGCLYSQSDITLLKQAFITSEMKRFDTISWTSGYVCFDIGTEPHVKFWSIFVDIFWDDPDLSATDKAKIDNKLSEVMGCFVTQIEEKHWSIYNGNNWTPILDKAALYWAIVYYHEDSRANMVIKEVLRTLWLHRDFYLTDGAYKEGIVEYTNVSYGNLREINNLMRQSFDQSLESVRWERTSKTSRWFLDFMVPDGTMADFGDSIDKRGLSIFEPLYMMMWQEMIGEKGIGESELDACSVYEFFSNVWFAKDFEDPWGVQPSMARDWASIVSECNVSTTNQTKQILFDQAETGVLKSYIPNASSLAEQNNLRFSQANYTWLGFNGVPNDFPHRELDFGALIWTAYGNRLLYDFGYGQIGKTSSNKGYLIRDGDSELWDNIALGANTLVVEDATDEHYTGTNYNDDAINSSQIYGARGTLENFDLEGYKAFVADGSAVYGRDDVEFGWLEFFNRYMIALDDGNFIVVDSFKTKDDRGDANISEYWYTSEEELNTTECSFTYNRVNVTLEDSKTLLLQPVCSMLERTANSTVKGKMVANSLSVGAFNVEPEMIVYKSRVGSGKVVRRRMKYSSVAPVSQDIRLFLLQATAKNAVMDGTISTNQCDATAPCFDITINGETKRLLFKANDDGHWVIDSFKVIKKYTLNGGWNLVGIDQSFTLDALKTQLGEENLEVIQGEQCTYQKRYHDLNVDFLNDFIGLEEGKGYWIKLNTSANLTLEESNTTGSIALKKGWNIISPYSNLTLEKVIEQIGSDNLLVIQGKNKTYQKSYLDAGKNNLNDFVNFEDYQGYWINVAEDVELVF